MIEGWIAETPVYRSQNVSTVSIVSAKWRLIGSFGLRKSYLKTL